MVSDLFEIYEDFLIENEVFAYDYLNFRNKNEIPNEMQELTLALDSRIRRRMIEIYQKRVRYWRTYETMFRVNSNQINW